VGRALSELAAGFVHLKAYSTHAAEHVEKAPFTGADEQARLACLAALDQLTGLAAFRAELPDLMGLKRGFPEIDLRIGIATGDVCRSQYSSDRLSRVRTGSIYRILKSDASYPLEGDARLH
jgi:hypothetical protein